MGCILPYGQSQDPCKSKGASCRQVSPRNRQKPLKDDGHTYNIPR